VVSDLFVETRILDRHGKLVGDIGGDLERIRRRRPGTLQAESQSANHLALNH
jgi:hypothetical protein